MGVPVHNEEEDEDDPYHEFVERRKRAKKELLDDGPKDALEGIAISTLEWLKEFFKIRKVAKSPIKGVKRAADPNELITNHQEELDKSLKEYLLDHVPDFVKNWFDDEEDQAKRKDTGDTKENSGAKEPSDSEEKLETENTDGEEETEANESSEDSEQNAEEVEF